MSYFQLAAFSGRLFVALAVYSSPISAEDRLADFQKLSKDYDAAEKDYFERELPDEPSAAQLIARWDAFPAWDYLPQFLELAQARPDDEVAYQCCLWIFDRSRNVGNSSRQIFSIDQAAWNILAAHHSQRDNLPELCFRATEYPAPAQEAFLRGIIRRDGISHDHQGFATLALGELLRGRHDSIEYRLQAQKNPLPIADFQKHTRSQTSPEHDRYFDTADAEKVKQEAARTYRDVLEKFAEVKVEFSAPGFRNLKTLGQRAGQSLFALEHLTIGSVAPEIDGTDLAGKPLSLKGFRGQVVVITFWFTGCGPCVAMIPTEKRLAETYQDRPFALLGVCMDETREEALKTVAEHGMTWPSWFDGSDRPILRQWNIRSFPTIYILDAEGRIAGKNLHGEQLETMVKLLMEQ